MLFTKEIAKITYRDVIEFCNQQISESINLDYKKDFPKDLEKTISAFANIMGGLVIIGIEDKDSKPKLPARGLKYQKGLRERVNSIILDNIYPPIFPEIQVCEPVGKKVKRTFIIIRIPQSNMTPHYIRHRTQAYIRTDDITRPERLALAEEIEWLRDRRKKSEELKKFLYTLALERYDNYLRINGSMGIPFCEATISIIPLYPMKLYKTPQEIKQISEEVRTRGYGWEFPYFPNKPRPIQDGISNFIYNEQTQSIVYTELNQFGLIYHKEDLGSLKREENVKEKGRIKEIKKTYFIEVITLIDLFLEASANFYERLGYWGLVEFKFSLEKLLGVELMGLVEKFFLPSSEEENISIDDKLKWQREYYVNEIKNKRPELLIELLKDIGWSLGWEHIIEDRIKDILKKNNRFPEITN